MTHLHRKKTYAPFSHHQLGWQPSPTPDHVRPPGPDGDAPRWPWGNQKTKHTLPRSFWRFLVHHVKELEVLLWCRRSRCSRIAHGVSSQKPQAKAIVERAAQPAPRVTSSIPGYTAWKVNTIDAHVHIFFVVSTTLTTLGAGKKKKTMDTICLRELWGVGARPCLLPLGVPAARRVSKKCQMSERRMERDREMPQESRERNVASWSRKA